MLGNRKDPLADAVKKVMDHNQNERRIIAEFNEELGINDRRQLPHEKREAYDQALAERLNEATSPEKYSPKQKQMAALAGDKNKIDAADLKKVRMQGHIEEEGSQPRTAREKELAAMKPPADKITKADVLKARGVIKQEEYKGDPVPFEADEPRKKRPDEPKTAKGLARDAMRAQISKIKSDAARAKPKKMDEEEHPDEAEDKALIKKMVKSDALKEAAYSAKAARAGKDIGKPGKMFSKIAKKAGERYGSEKRGKKVAGAAALERTFAAALAKIRAKHMKEEEQLDEVSIGKAIRAYGASQDPEGDYGYRDSEQTGDRLKKHIVRKFGAKAGEHAERYADASNFGRSAIGKRSDSGKDDSIANDRRFQKDRLTKSGKVYKQDISTLKGNIKSRLGSHTKPYLPEEEQLDEVSLKKMVSAYKERAQMNRYPGASFGDDEDAVKHIQHSEKMQDLAKSSIEKRYGKKGVEAAEKAASYEKKYHKVGAVDDPVAYSPKWTAKIMKGGSRKGKLSPKDQESYKSVHQIKLANIKSIPKPYLPEEEQINEKTLTSAETSKKEELVKKMKKGDWSERYGKRGKEVMYATATKMAKKLAEEEVSIESIQEEIRNSLLEKAHWLNENGTQEQVVEFLNNLTMEERSILNIQEAQQINEILPFLFGAARTAAPAIARAVAPVARKVGQTIGNLNPFTAAASAGAAAWRALSGSDEKGSAAPSPAQSTAPSDAATGMRAQRDPQDYQPAPAAPRPAPSPAPAAPRPAPSPAPSGEGIATRGPFKGMTGSSIERQVGGNDPSSAHAFNVAQASGAYDRKPADMQESKSLEKFLKEDFYAKSLKQIREAAPGYTTSGTLGGQALQARVSKQKTKNPQGLEKTGPKNIYEAAVKKVKKKMKNKLGKTDTGQKANFVNTEPEHNMMTGYR